MPANRILGVWSLHDVRWIDKPPESEFKVMNDIKSDVELLLHVAHHQRYWKKRLENEEDRIFWTRQQYSDHVRQYLRTTQNVADFLVCWNDNPVPSANPNRRKQMSNPNQRELHERDAQDKEREDTAREIRTNPKVTPL